MSDYIKKIRTDKGDKQIDYTALANLPGSMKNPYPITFTGGHSARYDGSSSVTVNFPAWSASKDNPPYTKDEADDRYAPITAAIRPTASGNPVSITDSVEWPLQGLKVYGKSTQDGTPSPESPAPIVSAGGGGSIALTISDGADQSQSITISTPNGLPGIPVDSDGNYTDAEGQQWVCDEIDYARGVRVQRIGQKHITPTDMITLGPTGDGASNRFQLSIKNQFDVRPTYRYDIGFSNYFQIENTSSVPEENKFRIAYTVNKTFVIFNISTDIVPLDDIQAFKTWLSGHDLIVYYMITPTETPLSEEEIAAYRALHTYDGTTVVSTAEPVSGIEARYVADGTKYLASVTDRIATLEASQTQIDEV